MKKPTIVCLCGSTRFYQTFHDMNVKLTLAGKIVLSIACDTKDDRDLFNKIPKEEIVKIRETLDELHLRKIDLADEVLILNVGGYIGESTSKELAYAKQLGKKVTYLEPAPTVSVAPEEGE